MISASMVKDLREKTGAGMLDCKKALEANNGDFDKALEEIKPDVVVDFTQPDVIFTHVKKYLELGIKSVIGTTGLTIEQIEELKKLSKENNTGVIIAPNFAIGAVLMMMFAKSAAKYFDNAEIIEYHHNQKAYHRNKKILLPMTHKRGYKHT